MNNPSLRWLLATFMIALACFTVVFLLSANYVAAGATVTAFCIVAAATKLRT